LIFRGKEREENLSRKRKRMTAAVKKQIVG
jgi:hypothetical protein